MDEQIRALLAALDRRLAVGDRLSATFARELAAIWRDAERALRQLIATAGTTAETGRAAVLLAQVKAILDRSGYDTLVRAATTEATNALLRQALAGLPARQAADLVQSAKMTLDALRDMASIELWAKGDETAVALWRSLAQHLLTARPVGEILQDLQDALDKDAADIATLFDTQVSIFGRAIEDASTKELGPEQPFLYAGPIDDKTREWCLARVGKVFTRAEIAAMDNGQMPNPMLTGGGYNCRHSFLAVESQALRDLAGTGERVPIIAADVARMRERKAAAKRKKAA